MHGAEHVISLFFNDVFKLPAFKTMNTIVKSAYRIFGSGAMHSPYAIFQKHSRRHNQGKNIGLMRSAETRMAGCCIAMQRFIRLRNALISTVTSAAFIQLKVAIIMSLFLNVCYIKSKISFVVLFIQFIFRYAQV